MISIESQVLQKNAQRDPNSIEKQGSLFEKKKLFRVSSIIRYMDKETKPAWIANWLALIGFLQALQETFMKKHISQWYHKERESCMQLDQVLPAYKELSMVWSHEVTEITTMISFSP